MPMIKDPRWAAINLDGTPAAGAKMHVYMAGTDNEAPMFSDESMTTRAANPAISDGRGYFPIRYLADGSYKVKIESANGSPISEIDGVIVD